MRLRDDLLPRWDIFEEHLDEAEYLWARLARARMSPDYTLAETEEVESRLVAHLEGLAGGGRVVSERLVEPALEADAPERTSAATYALLAERGTEAYPRILAAFEVGDGVRHAAIQRALEAWEGPERAEQLKSLRSSPLPIVKALALGVAAFHGDGLDASTLDTLARSEDLGTRVAALRCARFLPRPHRASLVPAALAATDPAVRVAGIELGLQCGSRAAWAACRALARGPSKERDAAWVFLACSGEERDLEPVLRGLREEEAHPQALWALGFSGRVAAADACLDAMRAEPRIAALAAEAFSAITGLRIEGSFVAPPPPEEDTLPPLEEESLDADLVPGPEAELPPPVVDAIAAWWKDARGNLAASGRLLRGQPFTANALLHALENEPMRRRHVLATELAIRSEGTLQLQTRGSARRQRAALKMASSTLQSVSLQPFDKLMTAE
jgi:uncharacterized protein (TIGR02270 family)